MKNWAGELPKDGAMLEGGEMAQIRAGTVQQKSEKVHAALQYAARFHFLEEEWHDCEELKPKPQDKCTFVDMKVEAKKHRTEWCAAASNHRCMRYGRSSKKMNMPGKCEVPEDAKVVGEALQSKAMQLASVVGGAKNLCFSRQLL